MLAASVVLVIPTMYLLIMADVATTLGKLLESAVDRRAQGLDILPEVDRGGCALRNTFWRELEFLRCH